MISNDMTTIVSNSYEYAIYDVNIISILLSVLDHNDSRLLLLLLGDRRTSL